MTQRTNIFLHQSGVNPLASGSYNYGPARMWLPLETVITIEPTEIGETRYIENSGVIVIWNGSQWSKFLLS